MGALGKMAASVGKQPYNASQIQALQAAGYKPVWGDDPDAMMSCIVGWEDQENGISFGKPKVPPIPRPKKDAPKAPPPPPAPKVLACPTPSVAAGGEQNVLKKTSTEVESFQGIASDPNGGSIYEGTWEGKKCQITEAAYNDMIKKMQQGFNDGIFRASSRAELAQGLYEDLQKNNKSSTANKVISWFIENVGNVEDPGPKILPLVRTAKAKAAEAKAAVSSKQFSKAADALIEADKDASMADKLANAYFKGIISTGETTVKVLEGVKTTCEVTLAVGAIVLSGGAAIAAGAGGGAIKVAEGGAPALYGDADKVNWGKVAEGVLDIVLSKVKLGKAVEEAVAKKVLASGVAKKFEAQVAKYVAEKFAGKFADKITEEAIKGIMPKVEQKIAKFVGEKSEEILKTIAKDIVDKQTKDKKEITWGTLVDIIKDAVQKKLVEEVLKDLLKDFGTPERIAEIADQGAKKIVEAQKKPE